MGIEDLGRPDQIRIQEISADQEKTETPFNIGEMLGEDFWKNQEVILKELEMSQGFNALAEKLANLTLISKEKTEEIFDKNEVKERIIKSYTDIKMWPLGTQCWGLISLKILYPEISLTDLGLSESIFDQLLSTWEKRKEMNFSSVADYAFCLNLWGKHSLLKANRGSYEDAKQILEFSSETPDWGVYLSTVRNMRLTFPELFNIKVDKRAWDDPESLSTRERGKLLACASVAMAKEIKFPGAGIEIINEEKETGFKNSNEQMPIERNY